MSNIETKISDYVEIKGWKIWYDRYGTGNKTLLLIPGSIGTGDSDYKHQLNGSNAFDLKKYTIVVIELPGWGRSRPPKRPYGPNVYHNDADCALQLMEKLGFGSFSVIAWSEGTRVALFMAFQSPAKINNLVVFGAHILISDKTLAPILSTRNTKKWSQERYDSYASVYGDSLQQMWDNYCNFCFDFLQIFPNNFYTKFEENLENMRCPVLIIRGEKDLISSLEHSQYLKEKISDSCLRIIANGSHNVHQQYAEQFKKIIEDFFKECDYDMNLF